MALDHFRSTLIKLDKANQFALENQFAKQGDANGRVLRVQLSNAGIIEDQSGIELNLKWRNLSKGNEGYDSFTVEDASQGLYKFVYPTALTSVPGTLECDIEIVENGTLTNTRSFRIQVEGSAVSDAAAESSNSFTALQDAVLKVNNLEENYAPRLTELTGKLAETKNQKIDKNGSGQVTWANVAQDARENISGNKVAVVGVNSVIKETIAPGSVSAEKTDFILTGKNLFNKESITAEHYVLADSGELISSTNNNASDFILVQADTEYTRTNELQMAFYDGNKNFISGSREKTFVTPPSTVYLRTTVRELDSFQLELGSITTEYEAFRLILQNKIESTVSDRGVNTRNIADGAVTIRKTDFIEFGKNLYDSKRTVDAYINTSNGEYVELSSYSVSDYFIPTNGHNQATPQPEITTQVVSVAFYDKDKQFLSGMSVEGTFDIPNDAYFFKISHPKMENFMVEYGNSISPYESYLEPKIKTSLLPQSGTIEKTEKSVHFGDSITGAFTEAERDYSYLIGKKTNLETYNVGFGGARMGQHPTSRYDAFCMYRIADAIVSGDWTLQDADTTGHATFPQRLATLKGIDFNKVGYITIAYGTNDWGGGHTPNLPVDNPNDSFDITNYYGATRYAIKTIQQAYPHLKIILVSPYYRYDVETGTDADDGWRPLYNANHHLIEYVDALIEVGDEFKTPTLDMWRELGINKYTREHYFDGNDGTHPNENGMDLIACRIAGQLRALYLAG